MTAVRPAAAGSTAASIRRRATTAPTTASATSASTSSELGLGLARQPPHALQPRLGRSGRQAMERAQEIRLVGRRTAKLDRARCARFRADQVAGVPRRARMRKGMAAIGGDSPFILNPDGKGWLFAPGGTNDGPLPTHYEPVESPVRNRLYAQQSNPTALLTRCRSTRWLRPADPEYPARRRPPTASPSIT